MKSDRELEVHQPFVTFIPSGMWNFSTPHEGLCFGFKSTL